MPKPIIPFMLWLMAARPRSAEVLMSGMLVGWALGFASGAGYPPYEWAVGYEWLGAIVLGVAIWRLLALNWDCYHGRRRAAVTSLGIWTAILCYYWAVFPDITTPHYTYIVAVAAEIWLAWRLGQLARYREPPISTGGHNE